MLSLAALGQSTQQPLAANSNPPVLASIHPPAPGTNVLSTAPLPPEEAITEDSNVILRRQMADQSAMLLQLATELKAAVDNSDQATLSIHIVRKADSIARLAHNVKEKMKHAVTPR